MTTSTGTRSRTVKLAFIVFALVILVLQFLPFGGPRTNPPVIAEPAWDSPRTRELFFRSCSDCHSNESQWPWYSHVAPVSWLVAKDVNEGREHLNISEWNRPQKHAHEAAEEVRDGEMPLWFYKPLHPQSWYSEQEKLELIAGLSATFGGEGGYGEDEDEDEHGRGRGRGGDEH